MAILSGLEIIRQRELGNIVIDPWDPALVGPNSVDLHLADKLYRYDRERGAAIDSLKPPALFDLAVPPPFSVERFIEKPAGGWSLRPGVLYLGSTREYTETHGFVPYIDGRSSMGRLGLFCHITAGRGDNGFCGNWTLELSVVEPLIIYAGQRIVQITYHTIEGAKTEYSGRYQGDRVPTGSKAHHG